MNDFVICEIGNWHYHIRQIGPEGDASTAICGHLVGWDTKIPIQAWGTKDHIPSVWCKNCARDYEQRR